MTSDDQEKDYVGNIRPRKNPVNLKNRSYP